MNKKMTIWIIALLLAAGMAAPQTCSYAVPAEEDGAVLDGQPLDGLTQEELDADSVMGNDIDEETENFGDDEDEDGITLFAKAKPWQTKAAGQYYNGYGTTLLNGALAKGLDVSSWQKTIDWQKAKADGVEYAIIRLGYGSDYASQDDAKLIYNVQQCEKYKIPYGFYLYSYANTAKKNESEIAHVLRLLKGTHPKYPVYYDLEDSGTTGKCSYATIRSYAVNFCKKIKAAGYTPGVYASLSWWNTKLYTSELDAYERWVAQWNKTGCTYKRSWKMWQCADDYYVNGISGRVDLNFAYKKFAGTTTTPTTTKPATTEPASQNRGWVTKDGKKYYYNSSGVMMKNKWFTVSSKKYYATSTGAIYRNTYKKIGNYYYGFNKSGARYEDVTVKISGKTYHFNRVGKAYLCKVKTKANLNKRSGPGTKYESNGLFKKGTVLRITRKNGDWWRETNGNWVNKDYLKVTKKYPY